MEPIYRTLSTTQLDPRQDYEPSRKRLLNILDSLLSIFIISTLVICYWHGTWHLISHYYKDFPLWAVLSFSLTALVVFNFMQPFVKQQNVHPKNQKRFDKLQRLIFIRAYHYVYGLCSIASWVNLWRLVPNYLSKSINVNWCLSVM